MLLYVLEVVNYIYWWPWIGGLGIEGIAFRAIGGWLDHGCAYVLMSLVPRWE